MPSTTCPIRSPTDENSNSRVYCTSAGRANSASILSALNRFSNTPRAITQIGLCAINGSNTLPSVSAILLPPYKKLYLLQEGIKLPKNVHTLEGLGLWADRLLHRLFLLSRTGRSSE